MIQEIRVLISPSVADPASECAAVAYVREYMQQEYNKTLIPVSESALAALRKDVDARLG